VKETLIVIIKIKNIEFVYENENEIVGPTAVNVSYNLSLNNSQLEGSMEIKKEEIMNDIFGVPLFEFNRFIHKKIMESL
jgi:hypothetical protein